MLLLLLLLLCAHSLCVQSVEPLPALECQHVCLNVCVCVCVCVSASVRRYQWLQWYSWFIFAEPVSDMGKGIVLLCCTGWRVYSKVCQLCVRCASCLACVSSVSAVCARVCASACGAARVYVCMSHQQQAQ